MTLDEFVKNMGSIDLDGGVVIDGEKYYATETKDEVVMISDDGKHGITINGGTLVQRYDTRSFVVPVVSNELVEIEYGAVVQARNEDDARKIAESEIAENGTMFMNYNSSYEIVLDTLESYGDETISDSPIQEYKPESKYIPRVAVFPEDDVVIYSDKPLDISVIPSQSKDYSHEMESVEMDPSMSCVYDYPSLFPDQFIVIEMHGGPECAAVCVDEDGTTKVFDNRISAEKYADDCQDGRVVKV